MLSSEPVELLLPVNTSTSARRLDLDAALVEFAAGIGGVLCLIVSMINVHLEWILTQIAQRGRDKTVNGE